MKYGELLRELHSLKGNTLISFHSLGDVEAVASSVALAELIGSGVVKSPDRINASGRNLLKKLNVGKPAVLKAGELSLYENLVLVDVANKDMLGEFGAEVKKFKGKIIAIDHHEHGNMLKNARVYEFPHRTSCCEVVHDLYRVSGKKETPVIATLLLAGVISDSARFRTANRETFRAVSELLVASGRKYEDVLQLASVSPDKAQVKKVVEGIAKAELVDAGQCLIGVVFTNGFESRTALGLVDAGCAVGIAANTGTGKIAMVKDSENPATAKINVGALLKQTGSYMEGSGGGHESVGGATGDAEKTKKAVEKLVEKLKALLAIK